MAKVQSRAAQVAAVLIASLFAVFAGEMLLRYVFPVAPQLNVDIYRRDEAGNLRLRPGIRRRHVTRLWDVEVAINREGWRDWAEPITTQGWVWLGLGDSFAFGWGVDLEQTYLSVLERKRNQQLYLRIVKAGIPGTGSSDQFQLMTTVWDRYRPHAVILSFFVGNDFYDVQMGGARQFDVQGGLLIHRPLAGQLPSLWTRLRDSMVRSSHLLQLGRAVQLNWMRPAAGRSAEEGPRAWDEWRREFAQVHLKTYPARTARGVEQTLEYLDRFQEFCREHDAAFVLLAIPRSYQVYPEEQKELLAALEIDAAELDLERPQRVLAEWGQRRGVPVVDLLPGFQEHARRHPDRSLYYYPDAHLNAEGHHVAAMLLDAKLPLSGTLR